MNYTVVLTERVDGNFHVTVPGLPDCTIDAPTRDDALSQIRRAIPSFINRSEILQLDIPEETESTRVKTRTPWEYFGKYKDQPEWGEVFDAIELERRSFHLTKD